MYIVILSFKYLQGRGALQDIDQMSLFKPLCKYTATVTCVRDIAPTLREAIKQAQSGTPGMLSDLYCISIYIEYYKVLNECRIVLCVCVYLLTLVKYNY